MKLHNISITFIHQTHNSRRKLSACFQIASLFLLLFILASNSGCKKFITVDSPTTSITGESVFTSDQTAVSAVTGIYTDLMLKSFSGNLTTLSLYAGLSSDELTLFDLNNSVQKAYYSNNLISSNATGSEIWNSCYPYIFICNSAIEKIDASKGLSANVKSQLIGEAKFVRGFLFFYLTNLYGDIPLPLSSDFRSTMSSGRVSSSKVYDQIIADLESAKTVLSSDYLNGYLQAYTSSPERTRPTKWAAAAMLSRIYLYTGQWAKAEAAATEVINNSSLFGLLPAGTVFAKNSKESIWQLQPVSSFPTNTYDGYVFILPSTGPNSTNTVYLSNTLIQSFETGDLRLANWVGKLVVGTSQYYYPAKYKVNATNAPVTEYLTMLRLGEVYLNRAEARTQLGNIPGALTDLNTIRTRAGLNDLTGTTASIIQNHLIHERQIELFSELGHRWLDLKRTKTVDQVMSTITPLKGGQWNTNWQLYPIPAYDLSRDLNLTQNPGY